MFGSLHLQTRPDQTRPLNISHKALNKAPYVFVWHAKFDSIGVAWKLLINLSSKSYSHDIAQA